MAVFSPLFFFVEKGVYRSFSKLSVADSPGDEETS